MENKLETTIWVWLPELFGSLLGLGVQAIGHVGCVAHVRNVQISFTNYATARLEKSSMDLSYSNPVLIQGLCFKWNNVAALDP